MEPAQRIVRRWLLVIGILILSVVAVSFLAFGNVHSAAAKPDAAEPAISISGPTQVDPGQTVSYTVTFQGISPETGWLEYLSPAGFDVESVAPSGSKIGFLYTWTYPQIPADSGTVVITGSFASCGSQVLRVSIQNHYPPPTPLPSANLMVTACSMKKVFEPIIYR
jgi:hypothetical protein